MVAWKEKKAVVCGHLGEIQATLCGVGRDKCGEAAVGHLLLQASSWFGNGLTAPASLAAALGCNVP